MFLLKKLLGMLLAPLSVCSILLLIGLLLLWFSSRQKAGKIMVSIGTLLLIIASYSPISDRLLARIEQQYQPLKTVTAENSDGNNSSIKWIVVLGGGHTSDPALPYTGQLSDPTLVRLIEGIRLYRQLPGTKLLVSGGKVYDSVSDAEVMANVAEMLGVSKQDIVLESESKDTEDEARIIAPMIGAERFLLVTSASHMPRSMALFTRFGMNPIPAPTNYQVRTAQQIGPGSFFPGVESLGKTDRAIYEILGISWAKLRGKA